MLMQQIKNVLQQMSKALLSIREYQIDLAIMKQCHSPPEPKDLSFTIIPGCIVVTLKSYLESQFRLIIVLTKTLEMVTSVL